MNREKVEADDNQIEIFSQNVLIGMLTFGIIASLLMVLLIVYCRRNFQSVLISYNNYRKPEDLLIERV